MKRKSILFAIAFLVTNMIYCADSLKIFIYGSFPKKESFQIYYSGTVYEFETTKTRESKGWSIKVPLPEGIKEGDELPIGIYKKRFGKYKDTYLKINFQTCNHYIIIYRNFRQKAKYPFVEKWQNIRPYTAAYDNKFWDLDSPPTLKPKKLL